MNRRSRIDIERDVHQAGDEAVGTELGAQSFADEVWDSMRVTQVDGGAAVRDDFFLIERDHDRDADVRFELAVLLIDILLEAESNAADLANLDALEFDRGANAQAVDVAAEVDDELMRFGEQAARAEDHDCDQDEADAAEDERANSSRIDSLTHDSSLIFLFPRLLRRG